MESSSSAPPPARTVAQRTIGRRPRLSRFLWILLTLTALSHLPAAIGFTEAVRRWGGPLPWVFGLVLYVGGTGLFLGRASIGIADHRRHELMLRLVDVPYFIHWCACLFTLLPSLAVLLVSPIVDLVRGDPVALPRGGFMWIYGVGLLLCAWGVLVRRRFFRIDRVEVAVKGLDPAFDGYKIAQLSDLHIGALTPKTWGFRWAAAANALQPDMAVVTGDMVTSGTEFHPDIAEIVGKLEAKDGVLVSMGNHDYFGNGEPLISMLEKAGAVVLRNDGLVLERDEAKLFVAAVDDTWTQRADLDRALRDRPEGAPTVLLAHDPDQFRQAARRGVDVMLSGHTHGGQVALPFVARHVNLSKLNHQYHLGTYQHGNSTLYVHPGLGTTGPPIRFGVAPAIALITLRCG